MKLKDCPNPVGRAVVLLYIFPKDAAELRECKRAVPNPGDLGLCKDFERADRPLGLIFDDMLDVEFTEGPAKGTRMWLPTCCWRIVESSNG